jgi:tRNA-dihydrouridine synthase B
MKIKNLNLTSRFFLAPMVEVNDIAFRNLCKKAGASLCWTGMISPLSKQKLYLEDNPAVQLFSINEKGIKEFIKKNEKDISLFDFNLGCPAKTARKLGFGSFLHHDLETIEKILKTMRESTDKPLCIKLRKSNVASKIIKIANKYCDAIAIHPRTQNQGYSGEPDKDFALKIKSQTNLPIIYSGNVNEKNYKELLKDFDFLMIGRAAIGNPNIFGKILGKKSNFIYEDWLREAQPYNLPFRQYKFEAMWFTKGREGAPEMRNKIAKAKTLRELKEIYSIS